MLYHFGLLQKGSKNLIPYVSKAYRRFHIARSDKKFNERKSKVACANDKGVDEKVARGFKSAFSHDCKPYFIGIWDTVGSLGHIHGQKFFDTTLNEDVEYGYHAVSIDEKRKKFPVNLWDESKKAKTQVIEQVWFSGVHSDVGGWYRERYLSDIAFAWMMDKANECGLRLKPDWKKLLNQNTTETMHESWTGFWKIWKPVRRTIPEGARIHQSVLDRIAEVKDYDPVLPKKREFVNNRSYQGESTEIAEVITVV